MSAPDPVKLLSLSTVSRVLDEPYMRLQRLVKAGRIRPDATVGEDSVVYLFGEDSVSRVRQILERLPSSAKRDQS